ITLYSNFAQEESLNISKNCKKGIRMKMEHGTYTPASAPYGYKIHEKQLVIVEEEAEIVQRIFRDYLIGKGCTEIARSLNQDQVARLKGASGWRRQTIAVILRNERYKGDCLWQKTYTEDVLPYKKKNNQGELPQFYGKRTHEGIVPDIQFELANILLTERGKKIVRTRNESPLMQKIRCESCGSVYRLRKNKGNTCWVCRKHDENAEDCASHRISEVAIHRAFITLYNKLRNNYKEILIPLQEGLEELQIQGARHSEEIQEINQRIAEISEQNLNLSGLMAQGILDSALFIPQIDALKVEMDKLKWQKKRLVGKLTSDDSPDKLSEVIAFLERSPKTISKFEGEFFDEMVENILAFDKEKITFVLYGGLKLEERL
ncbi:MAG: recombinase family protein, partial [Eubacteriales bacterium]